MKINLPPKNERMEKNISLEPVGCSRTSSGKRRGERQWTERAL